MQPAAVHNSADRSYGARNRAWGVPEEISELAERLKRLRSAGAIRRFRMPLSKETAQAVIRSPALSAVERGSILLCLAFADTDPRSLNGGSTIIDPSDAG